MTTRGNLHPATGKSFEIYSEEGLSAKGGRTRLEVIPGGMAKADA